MSMNYKNTRRLIRLSSELLQDEIICHLESENYDRIYVKLIDFNRYGAQIEFEDLNTLLAIENGLSKGEPVLLSLSFGTMRLRSPRPFRLVWSNHDLRRMGVEFT